MPLLDINQVMAEHFHRAPAFLSVDTQGLELAILKSIDYGRFRPEVICAETLVTGTNGRCPRSGVHGDEGLRGPRHVVREHDLRRLQDHLTGQARSERTPSGSPRNLFDSNPWILAFSYLLAMIL